MKSVTFVFYEDLVRNPEESFKLVFEAMGHAERFKNNLVKIMAAINRKSRVTSQDNAIRQSKFGKSKWMDVWPKETIKEGIKILQEFGMDLLYTEKHGPHTSGRELKQLILENGVPTHATNGPDTSVTDKPGT